MKKIEEGPGDERDLAKLLQICGFVKGTGFCTLVTGAAVLVQNSLRLFRQEFEEHIRLGRCPLSQPRWVPGEEKKLCLASHFFIPRVRVEKFR